MKQPQGPSILARGDDYLVAAKPAGLATTGRNLDDPDCLQGELMAHLSRRKVWAVHQLDKGTSGVCLFALRKPSVALWAERLKAGKKLYLGIIDGELSGTHEVHAPIGRVTLPDGRTQAGLVSNGKPAHSTIRGLASAGGRTLVVARIHTGRTHQIRLHLAYLGVPLVGEHMHRNPPCTALPYPALHSWHLALNDHDGQPLHFVAPLPPTFVTLLTKHGLPTPDVSAMGFLDDDE